MNNKGYAMSAVVYPLLLVSLILIISIMLNLNGKIELLNKVKNNILSVDSISLIPNITYNGGSNTCTWKNNYDITLSSKTDIGVHHYDIDLNGDGNPDYLNINSSGRFIPENGFSSCNVRFRLISNSGLASNWTEEQHIHMDTGNPVKPVVSLKLGSKTGNTYTGENWTSQDVYHIVSSLDDYSGISHYQYSTDKKNWYNVGSDWRISYNHDKTEFTYAIYWTGQWTFSVRTVDFAGNTSEPSDDFVVKIDKSAPSSKIEIQNIKTDRATLVATCSDSETGIKKYEYSKDDGATWIDNGTTSSYTFSNLNSATSYKYKIRCTNGVDLKSVSSSTGETSAFVNTFIKQISEEVKSGYTYATSRTIAITYDNTNVENAKYYFKSSVPATVASGIVVESCGTDVNPKTCTTSNVTTLTAGTWYRTTNSNPSLVYTSNGTLYAAIGDGKNISGESSYNITKIDNQNPNVNVSVSGKVATFEISDNIGVIKYGVGTSETSEPSYTEITSTTSITKTWNASSAGTYYVWVVDNAGRTSKKSFTIASTAFCSYNVGQIWNYDYTGEIQTFTVPCSGIYQLEVWGAQGGNTNTWSGIVISGGQGGYASGKTSLSKNQNLYIAVGGAGTTASANATGGGYNGGGNANTISVGGGLFYQGGGGGATHIAKNNNRGILSNYESYKSELLIVAGGGGGAQIYTEWPPPDYIAKNYSFTGGLGGTGGDSSFGKGSDSQYYTAGGGGGYYGGICGELYNHSGNGGTSNIDGVSEGSTNNGVREGNGYAKITLVSLSD